METQAPMTTEEFAAFMLKEWADRAMKEKYRNQFSFDEKAMLWYLEQAYKLGVEHGKRS